MVLYSVPCRGYTYRVNWELVIIKSYNFLLYCHEIIIFKSLRSQTNQLTSFPNFILYYIIFYIYINFIKPLFYEYQHSYCTLILQDPPISNTKLIIWVPTQLICPQEGKFEKFWLLNRRSTGNQCPTGSEKNDTAQVTSSVSLIVGPLQIFFHSWRIKGQN